MTKMKGLAVVSGLWIVASGCATESELDSLSTNTASTYPAHAYPYLDDDSDYDIDEGSECPEDLASSWSLVGSAGPSERYHHDMAYDPDSDLVVLFGGTYTNLNGGSIHEYYGDTWTFDGSSWADATPPDSPSVRWDVRLAWHPTLHRIVLFGGFRWGYLNETWAFDAGANSWTQIPTDPSPPNRRQHGLATDTDRGLIVLFGGWDGTTHFDDTWEFDGTTWTLVETASSPPARRSHALAYDSARGRIVLFGGVDDRRKLNDTWEYDGTTWTKIETDEAPRPRRNHHIAFDSVRGTTLLFGGEPGDETGPFLGDTWEYDGTNWVELCPDPAPSARRSAPMVWDSTRNRMVLFGGYTLDATHLGFPTDVWVHTRP